MEPLDMRTYFNEGRSFVDLFSIARKRTFVDIGAYCLMPNHFHILVKEKIENGITKFIGKLLTAYSMYFNKRQQRTGSLFEGRFKARHVDSDEYLKYLFSYIHLNPIKLIDKEWRENNIPDRIKAHKYLQEYPYSSHLDYHQIIVRKETVILNKSAFPEYFLQPKEFDAFISDWLSIKESFLQTDLTSKKTKDRPSFV
ncbi:MAG: transposase [Patescibacteria group bacterium]